MSFRSVPRALAIAHPGQWVPHFTSVINWTLRLGLSLLDSVTTIAEPWVAIVDMSIDVATQKAFVILRVPLSALELRESALTLEDTQCIGIKVAEVWNGETVCKTLKDVFVKSGNPIAIIKNGGSDLEKGVRLWQEQESTHKIKAIDDVGHVAANALKAEYSGIESFKNFLILIKKIAAKLRQSQLAFLTPPKIRSKGRFLSISKISLWAKRIEPFILNKNMVSSSIADKLKALMPDFAMHSMAIKSFIITSNVVSEFLALVKNEGLTKKTYIKAYLVRHFNYEVRHL